MYRYSKCSRVFKLPCLCVPVCQFQHPIFRETHPCTHCTQSWLQYWLQQHSWWFPASSFDSISSPPPPRCNQPVGPKTPPSKERRTKSYATLKQRQRRVYQIKIGLFWSVVHRTDNQRSWIYEGSLKSAELTWPCTLSSWSTLSISFTLPFGGTTNWSSWGIKASSPVASIWWPEEAARYINTSLHLLPSSKPIGHLQPPWFSSCCTWTKL